MSLQLDQIKSALLHFERIDTAVHVRMSPVAMHHIADQSIAKASSHGEMKYTFHGLPVSIDCSLPGITAEVDYRSGKCERLDLSTKVQNGQ